MCIYLNDFSQRCEYLLGNIIKLCLEHPIRVRFWLFIIAALNLLKTHEMTQEYPQALLCHSAPDFTDCTYVIFTYRKKQKTCKAQSLKGWEITWGWQARCTHTHTRFLLKIKHERGMNDGLGESISKPNN
jgi:hypothetical protein